MFSDCPPLLCALIRMHDRFSPCPKSRMLHNQFPPRRMHTLTLHRLAQSQRLPVMEALAQNPLPRGVREGPAKSLDGPVRIIRQWSGRDWSSTIVVPWA
jgi:hypothetical protein